MSLTFQSGESIKQALYDELQNILNPNAEVRVSAEGRMKQLEFTEGYGVFLSEITMNQSYDLAMRQLASVMLTRYVEEHWSKADDDITVVASDQAKRMIRSILPNGLYDPNSKIRTSVAYTISTIATLDWPNTWTELFDIIVKCLGGNEDSIHGAMQVLIEFTDDLESQISLVGPIIISEVYRIFEAEQMYNVKTRTCAVKIFSSLFKSINEHIDSKEEQEKILLPILPGLIDKLIYSLSNPNGRLSSFTMKTEIIKVFEYLVNEMPNFLKQFTHQILPPIWQLLTQTADIYVKVVVNQTEPNPFPDNDDEDELANFNTMILQIMEFIHSLVERGKFKAAIKLVLADLIYIMIVYMQITEEQIEQWLDDPEQFINDDYQEEGMESTVRVSSHDVIQTIASEFNYRVFPAFSVALARHINVAEAEKTSGSPYWWKIHEASMMAVGTFRSLIVENEGKFDYCQYLNCVQNLMFCEISSPYLLSRSLWVLCKFSSTGIYSKETLEVVLNALESSLAADKPLNLRIYAVRSIYELCDSLKESNDDKRILTTSKLGIFLDGIMAIVPLGKSSVLSLVLETLTLLVSFDNNFAAAGQSKIISLTIAVFLKYHDDPYLLEHVQDMLKILCQNPFCLQPLQEKIVPTLVSILNLQGEQANTTMQDIALDVLQTIVKYSTAPLSDQLILNAFPAAVQCILHTDDHAIMQSGGECLRAFVFVAPEQVCSFRNGEGLNSIIQVITMLLNPMTTEFSAVFVGRLVITVITKAGNMLGENVFLILKAVISKMQLVETLSVAMSLILTFAHLFISQMDALLNFLTTVPGPTGEPAIQYVFSQWLCRQHLFYGTYERKVSTMALCKLLEHGVTTKDVRLTSVTIRDKVDAEPKGRTRSQTASAMEAEWITIPILVKIFKILIHELSYLKEISQAGEESESEEDEIERGLDLSPPPTLKVIADCVNEDENEENDQLINELMQDPAFQINMEENLTKFLQNFSGDDNFSQFTQHLTNVEKLILRGIQVIVP